MDKRISIRLSEEDYEKLMEINGETKSDKVRNLLNNSVTFNSEENYFTKHFDYPEIKKFGYREQAFIALGVLMGRLWKGKFSEDVADNIIEFDKGNITPLYRSISSEAHKWEDTYNELLSFISTGLLLNANDTLDKEQIAFYRSIGEGLYKKFEF